MAAASPVRRKLLTPAERSELTSLAAARVPRSWKTILRSHNKTVSDLILKALNAEIKRLKKKADQERKAA